MVTPTLREDAATERKHYCGLDDRRCTLETCHNTRMIALNKELAEWYRARSSGGANER